MSTFNEIQSAVNDGRTTYKELIEELCKQNPSLATGLLSIAKPLDDIAVQRRLYKNVQMRKHADDKEALKDAMKAWDEAHPKPKSNRVPPPPRKGPLSEEEKAKRSEDREAKKRFMEAKRLEFGGKDATLGDMENAEKQWHKLHRAEKAKSKKVQGASLDAAESEEESDEEIQVLPKIAQAAKKPKKDKKPKKGTSLDADESEEIDEEQVTVLPKIAQAAKKPKKKSDWD